MRASGWIVLAVAGVAALALLLAGVLRPLSGAPTQAEQVAAIAGDLRCPVCPGESAAAANTPQAQAMRAQIAADLGAGMGRRQILDQFVAEYGTWILYRPPDRGAYLLLWLAPAVAVLAVGGAVWRVVAARGASPGGAAGPPVSGGARAAPADSARDVSGAAAPVAREMVRRLGRFL